jgi:putative redox protein
MAKQAVVEWQGGMHFEGTSSGHAVQMDSRPPKGSDQGMSPMALVLVALGGCTAVDVVDILAKERQQLTGLRIEVDGDQADATPAVYTHIRLIYHVRGHSLERSAVERAVRLSEEKYCSVGRMLSKSAQIEIQVEVEEDPRAAE